VFAGILHREGNVLVMVGDFGLGNARLAELGDYF